MIRLLCAALETQCLAGRLARPLMSLILRRIVAFGHRFQRFVERIEADRPFPTRRAATEPQSQPPKRPPAPDKLPRTFGWLGTLLPNIVPQRAHMASLLERPDVKALIAAAPAPMGRLLRPVCRMLGLPPPPILALPPRPRRVRAAPKPVPTPKPEAKWPHDPRRRTRLGFYIGPPPMLPLALHPRGPPRGKTPA